MENNMINVKFTSLINMDPLQLATFLRNEVDLMVPDFIDSKENMKIAIEIMNKATSYICYFKEMETLTKSYKRNKRREGCKPEEIDRILGCEEVFETYKKISEQIYDQIVKMMTMKRLMNEEENQASKTV